jgi:hypothetical protein
MIEICTIQLAKWRLAKREHYHILNITAQSGLACFAPEFGNVRAYKNGELTEEQYVERYMLKMRDSYVRFKDDWARLKGHPKIAIACYCPKDAYCHRRTFSELVQKYLAAENESYVFKGELG